MFIRKFSILSIIISHLIFLNLTNNSYALPLRRSCGTDLTRRIAAICSHLGGYNVLESSNSNVEHHHRVRRRVADECCKNICSDSVISQYCYNSSDKIPRAVEKSYEANYQGDESNKVHKNDGLSYQSQHTSDGALIKNPIYEIQYQPFKIGTVAPEYTKTAMTPQLLSRIHLLN